MPLIDTHAHLDFPDFNHDRNETVKRAKKAGVFKIINIGADLVRSKASLEIAAKNENIWATVGIHPEGCNLDLNLTKKEIKGLALSPKVVAIGECGLDYFYDESVKVKQKELFKLQIQIAKENRLPLVVHIRNGKDQSAAKDAYQILKENEIRAGVVHCFTLEKDWARKFLDLGLHLGFTGIVTYKNADLIRESVKVTPIEKLLVETDCPYLAPQKYRGQRNEPSYVTEVAAKIAEVKELSLDQVTEQTTQNAEELFKI